jgi:allantoin racemase
MHVRVILPVITARWIEGAQEGYASAARASTEVSVVALDWGPASIESYRDETLVVPDIMTKAVEAERDGADALIIDCMADPGLEPARELVDIPVVGPAQASMHLAATLGHRFSMLVLFERDIALVERQARAYGVADCLASSRPFDVPVLELERDVEGTLRAVVEAGELAVREDGAHILIPGCTGLAGWATRIQAGLAERGCEVPVLDPPTVAMKLAESLVDMGLSHSKRTYPSPPSKEIRWPWEAGFGT